MSKLFTLATSVLLTLGVSSTTLAYNGDFVVSGATTMPALLQFDAGHGAAMVVEVPSQGRLKAATGDDQSVQTEARPDERQAATDEFQRYFDRHFRAHLVLDESTHHRLEAQ